MTWWQRLWRRDQMEDQLEKELRFHLEQHSADLVATGIAPAEARRQARLALGGPEQVKEECRDARGTRWLEDLWLDLRYALRTLRQRRGFAAVSLLTLVLGIGATTVMFTLINGVLLKPLPYPQPERLVTVNVHASDWNTAMFGEQNLAYLDFLDCKSQAHSLALTGMMYQNGGIVSEPGEAEYVDGLETSYDFFSVLGVPLFRGRAFLPEEDRPSGAPVAIISYNLWDRHYGRSPAALGAPMSFNGKAYTVIGIMPAGFRLNDYEFDVTTPLGQDTSPLTQRRDIHPIAALARLVPGATLAQAQTELSLIGRGLAQQYPKTNADRSFLVQPLRPDLGDSQSVIWLGDVRSTLWLLLGAVSLVLLIACANIASLLLARAVSREREFAMRVALGAGRGRLVRQCLTESGVLGLAGGLLGVCLADMGLRPFVSFWPGSLPRAEEVSLDWRVLLFALGISLASGLLFGLAPALRLPVRNLDKTLRSTGRTLTGTSRRLHGVFVVSEVALAVVLLVSAGMLGRTLLRLSSTEPGLNIHNVLTARTALSPATLQDPALTRAAWQDLLDRVRRVPGVQVATMVDTVPLRQGNNPIGYSTTADLPPEDKQPLALTTCVSPDFLKVMGIPLLQGRFFDDQDRAGNESVVVIDDVMAQQAFPGRDPVGAHLWGLNVSTDPVKVIGVVGHVRYWGLAADDQAKIRAQVYYPFAQIKDRFVHRWSDLMSIAMRTSVPPLSAVESLRGAVRGATGGGVLYEVRTMEQLAAATLARQRFLLLLFGVFAGLALLLACIGIYGVLSYLTGQRVPEIGVRIALGATAGNVVRLVLRQSLAMIFVGVGLGAAAALAAGRLLQRSVDGVRSMEPAAFAVMVCVLVSAALAASFLPARRASRIDPVSALRQD
jgi:predicted permease